MYGVSALAVDKKVPAESVKIKQDKGLGFDFSAISDFVKNAATTGLNIYQNQIQLKQMKAMGVTPNYGAGQYVSLPMNQAFMPQPTFGGPQYMPPPSGGMGTGTMLMIGAVVLGGIAFMTMRKSS